MAGQMGDSSVMNLRYWLFIAITPVSSLLDYCLSGCGGSVKGAKLPKALSLALHHCQIKCSKQVETKVC